MPNQIIYVPDYKTLKHFEPRHSGGWIAKFGNGDLTSLNVINGYAPIISIDLKFFNGIEESLTLLPTGLTLNTLKGFERPTSISATFFETDTIQVSQAIRSKIQSLDAYTKNRVLAYSDLQNFATDLMIDVYKKDGTGIAETYIYSVIPKSGGEYSLNQNSELVTFNVDFLVVGFNKA